ncbi:hypothetical protein POM88_037014 [Heracleum sosnowskyi]|uniref:Uncharacterized protein n=1 Tax=Heracleum sosnowskyi TaxID=360622 RepID=A0AAD8MFH0_9APIA|nr:hypothetical protein POM88_037014 [Heracleum sosnowskyi]
MWKTKSFYSRISSEHCTKDISLLLLCSHNTPLFDDLLLYLLIRGRVIPQSGMSCDGDSGRKFFNPVRGPREALLIRLSTMGQVQEIKSSETVRSCKQSCGTATAHLINSFHTPQGARLAKKQVKALGKFFSFSFTWGFFQWFFTASDGCGFKEFPTFGLEAYRNNNLCWCRNDLSISDQYLSPSSLNGLQGYKVFIAIAMILGDGLYNFLKVLGHTLFGLFRQIRMKKPETLPVEAGQSSTETPSA